MNWRVNNCLGACVLAVIPLVASALEPDKLFDKVSPSCWGVMTFDARHKPLFYGSAVVIAPGRLITNCHVLQKEKSIKIMKANVSYEARLEFEDAERDLCQIKVDNFTAPPVQIAETTHLRIGQKVYAIGNPEGLELTLSEGLISSLRYPAAHGQPLIQTTAPISHGSSGGGLFDSDGHLIGITTFGWKSGQSLNFAHPAGWIYEVEARSRKAIAKAGTDRESTPAPSTAATNVPAPKVSPDSRQVGETWTYELADRLAKSKRVIDLRIDKIDEGKDRIIFNQGARIEDRQGRVIEMRSPEAGAFDAAMPPDGWVELPAAPGKTWKARYEKNGQYKVSYDLTARVSGDEIITVPAGKFRVTRIEWRGSVSLVAGTIAGTARGSYKAIVWYSQELNRVIQFSADYNGPMNSYAGLITHETLYLTSHTTE